MFFLLQITISQDHTSKSSHWRVGGGAIYPWTPIPHQSRVVLGTSTTQLRPFWALEKLQAEKVDARAGGRKQEPFNAGGAQRAWPWARLLSAAGASPEGLTTKGNIAQNKEKHKIRCCT